MGIVPVADEDRKTFDAASLQGLLAALISRHPGARFRVFVNPRDRGAARLAGSPLPGGAEWRSFTDLRALVAEYEELAAWYGTDTGLYHLAAAMGIPATVFFGPTQPWKIVAPEQEKTSAVRLAVLGRAHCEEKRCTRPFCLHRAVASFAGSHPATALADAPGSCPLRAHPPAALAAIDEAPRR